ncbi:MAG TPA: PPOX class F420-dependent oxidoreductase [Terriglobales bacterium]|nr:PPOX class F420-dependent oxidoreductase [Terriglobales bacterium]
MDEGKLAQFRGQKYLNLETFKRNGEGIKTPVWFEISPEGTIYTYTMAHAWKVKRARNNPRVRVAPCDVRGNVFGTWVEGTARVLEPGDPEFAKGNKLLDQKYFLKRIFNWAAKLRGHKRAGIAITV